MIRTSKNLKEIDNKTVIWRYMDFASLYRLITTNEIYFRRLDKYSDKLEGTLPIETQTELYHYRLAFPFTLPNEAETWTKNEVLNIETYKAWTLSNSWIMNDDESYAMWKIYCSENGIAIKTNVNGLKSSLANNEHEIYVVSVDYDSVKRQDLNQFTVATNKRKFYKYENEIRAIMINQFKLEKNGDNNIRIPKYSNGVGVSIDLSILIDSIYVSPFAGKWFFESVIQLCEEKLVFLSKEKIIQSEILDK